MSIPNADMIEVSLKISAGADPFAIVQHLMHLPKVAAAVTVEAVDDDHAVMTILTTSSSVEATRKLFEYVIEYLDGVTDDDLVEGPA